MNPNITHGITYSDTPHVVDQSDEIYEAAAATETPDMHSAQEYTDLH